LSEDGIASLASYSDVTTGRGAMMAEAAMLNEVDLRPLLPTIRVPTLALHRTEDPLESVESGRFLASRIPGARLVELPGRDALMWMGDGYLATFDGLARAIASAEAIVSASRDLGIEIRSGVHTGEIELDGDDVAGIGVANGARIAAIAGPSEVVVSQTVRDLVVGAGASFEDAGEHELKGVPGRWRPFRVTS
jgi:hypothetical protein